MSKRKILLGLATLYASFLFSGGGSDRGGWNLVGRYTSAPVYALLQECDEDSGALGFVSHVDSPVYRWIFYHFVSAMKELSSETSAVMKGGSVSFAVEIPAEGVIDIYPVLRSKLASKVARKLKTTMLRDDRLLSRLRELRKQSGVLNRLRILFVVGK